MRYKLYKFLNNIYGIMMTVSFFAGLLPFFMFIFAIIIGGETGQNIAIFLYKNYYPYVIVLGSSAIVVGLIAMYIAKLESLSLKEVNNK